MAFDNAGAYWIQPDSTTANPYYGAMMLRCGSEREILGERRGPDMPVDPTPQPV